MTVTGEIIHYAGPTAPTGWLPCDGSFVSKTTYSDLFSHLGHFFNGGTDPLDGTFKLPDMRAKLLLGQAASGTGVTRGGTGGSAAHTHTGPSHTHPVTVPGAHGSHTIGQASDHTLGHTGPTVNDHAALTHSGLAVPNHTVGQPGDHGSHSSAGGHVHGNHTTASTFLSTSGNNYLGPSQAGHISGSGDGAHAHDAHSAHASQAVSAHSVTQAANHAAEAHTTVAPSSHTLTHASANLDAHSTHAGGSTIADGTGATGTGDSPTMTLMAIVKT